MLTWSNILTRKPFLPKFICFTYPKLYKAALKPSNFLISFEYRIYIYYLQLECPRQLFVWFFPVLFHAHQFDCKQLWIGKHLDQLDMYWPEIIFKIHNIGVTNTSFAWSKWNQNLKYVIIFGLQMMVKIGLERTLYFWNLSMRETFFWPNDCIFIKGKIFAKELQIQ